MWKVRSAVGKRWSACSPARPRICFLDLPRGDGDTLHILRWLQQLRPDFPVIVLCSPEDAEQERRRRPPGRQEDLVRPFDERKLESGFAVIYISTET